jgi:hypothetical protein
MMKPTQLDRATVTKHGLRAYKAVPYSRYYCLSEENELALGAITAAVAEANKESGANSFDPEQVTKVLQGLAKFMPSLVQARPAPEAPTPEPWKDLVTGEVARNPYKEPRDFASIAAVEKNDPALAEYLKRTADGISYSQLAKENEAKAKREQLRALPYGESEHTVANNPLLGNDLTKINQFVRLVEPEAVEFYRSEAKPVELALDNLTLLGQLAKHAPELRPVVGRAGEIMASWRNDDYQAARAQRAAAEAKLEAARARQGHIAA